MYRPFEICINRFNHVCIDWNNELFEEPFNKGLSTISEKILTKTILEDTISKNIIQYFISKSNNLNMCKVDVASSSGYAGTQFDGVTIYKIFNQGFKFKNIFDLQEEYIPVKLEDKKRLEKEKEKQKRIEEAQRKIKEKEENKQLTENFICPITLAVMKDPVICSDSHTYERSAIEKWLSTNNHSPITRQIITKNSLIPNIVLRNIIQEYEKYNY